MAGGTLVVSKAYKLHTYFKTRFEELGFEGVTVTGVEKDGLSMLIRDMKPRIVFMGCKFYQCCTPFMMADLHRQFPKLNIAAVSLSDFPDDLAMYFIVNGARSYVNMYEGMEEFYKGLKEIREGGEYISPGVRRRFEMRNIYPEPTGRLTDRQVEIARCVANGFTGVEIAETLGISERSVDSRKTEIYTAMNVRNENEVIRAALCLGIIKPDELQFFGGNFALKPLPEKKKKRTGKRAKALTTATAMPPKTGGFYDYQN
jgi:DNA-binding NarL/FixJ family response regulator